MIWSNDNNVNDLVERAVQQRVFIGPKLWFPRDESGTRVRVQVREESPTPAVGDRHVDFLGGL